MIRLLTLSLCCHIFYTVSSLAQGTIEAETVKADTLEGAFKGDGSRLTNLPNQNLAVSVSGDTLFITEGNWVLIPGLSASNSGNATANAGVDIPNSCQTSFNLNATPASGGEWSIISGTGGSLSNSTQANTLFTGVENESYLLQWTVDLAGGMSAFDQMTISIADNTTTSVANAGPDQLAVTTQSVTLAGNAPAAGSESCWKIISGGGGTITDTDTVDTFLGVPGESYTLELQHFNDCSSSADQVVITFTEGASGEVSSNGRYLIPDPKFRSYLQIAYPLIMEEDSLIVAMGNQVKEVKINNLGVLNLDGLQYLSALRLLNAGGNVDLSSIPFFAESLENFQCSLCNSLTIIPSFPQGLDTINGTDWVMSTIPEFPEGLKSLYLFRLRSLLSLPVLPDSCEFVGLYGVGTPPSIPDLPDTINIPEMAKEFYINEIKFDAFPLLPQVKSNLEMLEISETNITVMPSLQGFTSLTDLNLRNNSLLKLDSLPAGLTHINVPGNPLICVTNKPAGVAATLAPFPICP